MNQNNYRCYSRPCLRTKRQLRGLITAVKAFEAAMQATALTDEQAVLVRQLSVQRFLATRFAKVEASE